MFNVLKVYKVDAHVIQNGSLSENVLNKFPIYVINLKKDIYRRAYIKYLFKKLKINYTLIMVENVTMSDIKKWGIKQKFENYKINIK